MIVYQLFCVAYLKCKARVYPRSTTESAHLEGGLGIFTTLNLLLWRILNILKSNETGKCILIYSLPIQQSPDHRQFCLTYNLTPFPLPGRF